MALQKWRFFTGIARVPHQVAELVMNNGVGPRMHRGEHGVKTPAKNATLFLSALSLCLFVPSLSW
jgi:hypothetical protein